MVGAEKSKTIDHRAVPVTAHRLGLRDPMEETATRGVMPVLFLKARD